MESNQESGAIPGAHRYYVVSCHVLWRELCHFAARSRNVFDWHFLEQGLHNTPEILRSRLQAAVDHAPEAAEAVLIGYGLCSNGIVGITSRDKPLVLMRGHDCITFLLGSKERYREYFDAHPGTYWYSPGWIDTNTQPGKARYERLLRQYAEHYGEENAAFLMEAEQGWFENYNNAAYVDLGFGENAAYQDYTRECAQYLNWQADFLQGDPRLVMALLEGEWNREDFLVVPPCHQIVPSHDAQIIAAVPLS